MGARTPTCIGASAVEPALHGARQAKLQEHAAGSRTGCRPRDFACQLYLDSLLPAVPTTAGWQLSQGMAADGPTGPMAIAMLRTVQSP